MEKKTRWARFCGWLLRKMGWTSDSGPIPEDKGIILGVPHTSFMDFVVSYLFYAQFGIPAYVMIKKEFFFWNNFTIFSVSFSAFFNFVVVWKFNFC